MMQVSSIERLRSLPELFRGAELTPSICTGGSSAAWSTPWGEHSDLYAKLLVSRHPNWERALVAAMPSALVIGTRAVRQAGWPTRIPHCPTVAVDASQPVFTPPIDSNLSPGRRRGSAWCVRASRALHVKGCRA